MSLISAFFVLLSCVLYALGVLEISFPDVFSWAEVSWVANHFPKAWKYTVHIGVIQVVLGSVLLIPAWKSDKVFAARAVETLARLGLGGMFIFASIFKIADPHNFAVLVAQYQFLPHALVNPFALLMPQLELWFGIALILTPFVRESSLAILAMFGAFIVALSWALWFDLGITCGCFQLDGAQSKSEAWTSLIRDLVLLVPNLWLLARPQRSLIGIWRSR